MKIEIANTEHGVRVLTPHLKYLDALHATSFRQRMIESVLSVDKLVVDCSHILYVDSTGLASLVSVFKALEPGGQMSLACMNPDFSLLLEQTMLHKIFPCFKDVRKAVSAWSS